MRSVTRRSRAGWDRRLVTSTRTANPSCVVVVAGVNDLLVVRTRDAVLVMPREDAEGVKAVVKELEKQGFERYL